MTRYHTALVVAASALAIGCIGENPPNPPQQNAQQPNQPDQDNQASPSGGMRIRVPYVDVKTGANGDVEIRTPGVTLKSSRDQGMDIQTPGVNASAGGVPPIEEGKKHYGGQEVIRKLFENRDFTDADFSNAKLTQVSLKWTPIFGPVVKD